MLSAVGIQSNIEGIGLEELGVAVERDKVVVDEFYRTNVPGVYAIGDIVPGPALAHVASAEAVCCVESICGLDPAPVDYTTIPSCIFTQPEVASVGMTEQQAQERGIAYKAGRFPSPHRARPRRRATATDSSNCSSTKRTACWGRTWSGRR